MLVLSRRLNQTIVIDGRVRVTVLAITPNRVEIGIEAPLQVAVDREEVHLRRQTSGEEYLSPRRQDAKEEPEFRYSVVPAKAGTQSAPQPGFPLSRE